MTTNLALATTLTPRILASVQLGTTSDATVYTVSAATTCVVKSGSLTNTGGSAITVSLSVIPAGGAVDGTHKVLSGLSIAAGDTFPLKDYIGEMCLGPGDSVHVIASTANAINVLLTGVESS